MINIIIIEEALEIELVKMNEMLTIGIYLPLWDSTTSHYCICKIVPEESKILKSRDRVPFILTFEAVEGTEPILSESLHLHAKNSAEAITNFGESQKESLSIITCTKSVNEIYNSMLFTYHFIILF